MNWGGMLVAAILAPLTAVAKPLPLQHICFGYSDSFQVTLEVFFTGPQEEMSSSIVVVARESARHSVEAVVQHYSKDDLIVDIKEMVIKSAAVGAEFFFELDRKKSEFNGIYVPASDITNDYIAINCLPSKKSKDTYTR